MKKQMVAFLLCALALCLRAADMPGSKENPFLKRIDGSSIVRYKIPDHGVVNFWTVNEKGSSLSLLGEGNVLRMAYSLPGAGRDTKQIFAAYLKELKDKGFAVEYSNGKWLLVWAEMAISQQGFEELKVSDKGDCGYVYATKEDPAGFIRISVLVVRFKDRQKNIFQPGDIGIFVDSCQSKPKTN